MEAWRLPHNNNPLFFCFLLYLLCAGSLISCDSNPPPEPVLRSSKTYSELESGQPLSLEIEVDSQAVLIEILGRDTNYRSRVFNAKEEVASDVHLAYLRSAPVYHFIEPGAQRSSHTLEINPVQLTRLAAVTVNVYALSTVSAAEAALKSAWRQLARGLQFVDSKTAADWAQNLAALEQAGHSFEQLGLHQPAMWARYFKAYFEYYPLYRYAQSLAAAEKLIDAARQWKLPVLLMLSHQLAGQIRNERDAGNDEEQARLSYQQAQENFNSARQLAQDLNNGFETIWAINNYGITYSYQDQIDLSLDHYREALDLAIDLQDHYLTNLIGTNIAVAQEIRGQTKEAIETLLRLQSELTVQNDPLELEHVLNLLGRYYLKLYQFPQALEALTRALENAQNRRDAENRGRSRLLLGLAYREMGEADKSRVNLRLSIPDLQLSRNGRGLKQAWALSADINRLHQRFAAMAADRARQEQYLATDFDRADWLASKARDAEAGQDFVSAIWWYRRSEQLFASTIYWRLGQLALLHACVLETRQHALASCSVETLAPAHQAIQALQASVPALEGKYLWAQLQALAGHTDAARALMTELVDDIRFYRNSLPGVLGAWYWDARKTVFDFYMELHLESAAGQDDRAHASLAALIRLRNTEFSAAGDPIAAPLLDPVKTSAGDIRALIAQRERAETTQALEAAQRNIDQFLLASAHASRRAAPQAEAGKFQQQLEHLPADWSFLTYYFSAQQAYAWTGSAAGLKLHRLGSGKKTGKLIARARAGIRTVNSHSIGTELAELGARLIAPIQAELKPNILFLGAGELNDFPLEALTIQGELMLRNHRIVHVMSGLDLDRAVAGLGRPFTPRKIFLAGNPLTRSGGPQPLGGAAKELLAIQAQFPGARIDLFEGRELSLSAFNDKAFSTADLVHIATHARIDRGYPELSRILLSAQDTDSPVFFTPADLAGRPISAWLVVLSACETVGLNRFEYDSNLGFVAEFLQSGGSQVMASLWPVPDRATAFFMAEFYRRLATTADVAAALQSTKLHLIDAGQAGVDQWGAFQLFSR
jgi:CHAT domain-containing protein/tetratricopeptide (TPR) repeat protein